jgi:hypothetical protein
MPFWMVAATRSARSGRNTTTGASLFSSSIRLRRSSTSVVWRQKELEWPANLVSIKHGHANRDILRIGRYQLRKAGLPGIEKSRRHGTSARTKLCALELGYRIVCDPQILAARCGETATKAPIPIVTVLTERFAAMSVPTIEERNQFQCHS